MCPAGTLPTPRRSRDVLFVWLALLQHLTQARPRQGTPDPGHVPACLRVASHGAGQPLGSVNGELEHTQKVLTFVLVAPMNGVDIQADEIGMQRPKDWKQLVDVWDTAAEGVLAIDVSVSAQHLGFSVHVVASSAHTTAGSIP